MVAAAICNLPEQPVFELTNYMVHIITPVQFSSAEAQLRKRFWKITRLCLFVVIFEG